MQVQEIDTQGVDPSLLAYFDKAQEEHPPTLPKPDDAGDDDAPTFPDPPAPAPTPETPPAAPVDPAAPPPAEEKPFESRIAKAQEERRAREQEASKARDDAYAQAHKIAEQLKADPIAALRQLARDRVGSDDPKALAAFLEAEVYTPLMVEVLALRNPDQIDPVIKTRAEMRTLNYKLEQETRAREAALHQVEQQRIAAEHSVKVVEARGLITRYVDENRAKFPHLAIQDDPVSVLFESMSDDGELSIDKAAELADRYFQKEARRYEPLFGGQQGKTAATSANAKPAKSATESASLTNSGASKAAVAADGKPDLSDPDASAEYWSDLLERDPEAVKRLVPRRR